MREPKVIFRCPCGAVLTTGRSLDRHVAGKTMCQHRGKEMRAYKLAPEIKLPTWVGK